MNEEFVQAIRDTAAYVRWLKTFNLSCLDLKEVERAVAARPSPVSGNNEVKAIDKGIILVKEDVKQLQGARVQATEPGTTAAIARSDSDEFTTLRETISSCQKCGLGALRKQAVFGSGNPDADLMFIGEAPGATEDETGLPFVGAAGRVLSQELEKNGIVRDDVFIANIIKCRPPANRDPLPDEISSCEPYLHEQIRLIKPKMLCALGRYAAATLLKRVIKITAIRGTWLEYQGLPLFICLHPSCTLYQQSNRAVFNEDIAALARTYHDRLTAKPHT